MPHATTFAEERPDPLETSPFVPSSTVQIPSSEETMACGVGQHVEAQLHYLTSSVEYTESKPPIQVVTRAATHSDPRTTVKLSQGPLERINDVRGREDQFTLERNGFTFVKHSSQVGDWECRENIWTDYVEKECKELVANVFGGLQGGVDEVIAFHEGKRGSNKEWRQSTDGQRTNPFARQVHVDQTQRTIRQIVQDKTDIKAEWLWKGRVRQVNAWKPLYHPVYDCGLCVADAETLTEEDCIEAKRIRETDGGFLDTMGVVKYREGRQWYYKSLMEPDDVVLFMGYDSDFTIHSAFDIPNPPLGSPPRASIEVRLLVFTWPKEPLFINPPLGMLTAHAPPRSEEIYESHHTSNLEVEGFPLPSMNDEQLEAPAVIALPDASGNTISINLADYDPKLPHRLQRADSFNISSSPNGSPYGSPSRRFSISASLKVYEQEISESQLVTLVSQRTEDLQRQLEDLKRQLEVAERTRDLVSSEKVARASMTRVLNERRRDELRRGRREMANMIRGTVENLDL
ncbi:hypothetical protein BLS_005213 [Venturia inaequalis]|uniref:Uncharacterized protein n=1 Tax=Venturia inaequalis TaxID=5025 RepID=A0A8H3UHT0_VENIN|nr:hypothetical protein BLS_005213 [Venturia inaequalis]KAE9977405.1 hypothetical protein EG328_002053 [Venturia inaequalis]